MHLKGAKGLTVSINAPGTTIIVLLHSDSRCSSSRVLKLKFARLQNYDMILNPCNAPVEIHGTLLSQQGQATRYDRIRRAMLESEMNQSRLDSRERSFRLHFILPNRSDKGWICFFHLGSYLMFPAARCYIVVVPTIRSNLPIETREHVRIVFICPEPLVRATNKTDGAILTSKAQCNYPTLLSI